MREIALFVEDYAHEKIIGSIIKRLAEEANIETNLNWRSVRRGHGRVAKEFDEYIRDINKQGDLPDLIVVATDANCKGYNQRSREINVESAKVPIVLAIPDPHIERWLLLDGAAFKEVLGKGCDAPDQKCNRHHYKVKLIEAIQETGVTPSLGGIEYAEEIVTAMDLDRASKADVSFQRFTEEIKRNIKSLKVNA